MGRRSISEIEHDNYRKDSDYTVKELKCCGECIWRAGNYEEGLLCNNIDLKSPMEVSIFGWCKNFKQIDHEAQNDKFKEIIENVAKQYSKMLSRKMFGTS